MRGKHATKPMEEVIAEATELAQDGVRELVVVAQDTTYYGLDLYGRTRLAELLTQLEAVPGIEWIRIMYLYPMYFSDDVIDVIARSKKIIPYLDLPLQHINDTMLRRMARQVAKGPTEELLTKLRERIPGLVMRTTFITGFPGETEEQFEELVEFVARQKFERLGVFTYSFEPDTPAARLPDQLSDEVKQSRRARLMAVQQKIAFDWTQAQIGQQWDVLIDRPVPGEKNAWIGRSYADAPDVDGVVYVTGSAIVRRQNCAV
jgi:ribosomal protein S12 methylthiotransferase